MALCYNATEEEQNVKVYGNWFSFKPGQIKQLEDKFATAITLDKREHGIVELPVDFEDPSFRSTDSGKSALASKKAEGLEKYLGHLRGIVANNQISLRRDLEQANIKADPSLFASAGEIKAAELLAKYQKTSEDASAEQAAKFKELVKKSGVAK